jgi:AIR synthase-related protein
VKRDAASSELDLSLDEITAALLRGRGLAHKRDISDVVGMLARALPDRARESAEPVANGDDCAAIPDGDGYLLFAIEGFVEDFVLRMPWFAGYCGVMVNVSDIYAMGGRPIAVVDALWSRGSEAAQPLLEGLAAASTRYGVPIVGGHTNSQSDRGQLAVSIVGRASKLLTSFDARPGDCLVMAIDLRGAYEEPHPYWNASTRAPAERLRADLEVLPGLAEDGLCDAAKDISMAGAIGTTLMLLECSRVGAVIDVDAIPHPDFATSESADGVPLLRWLQAFPSYGFVLSVRPDRVDAVLQRFLARDIACAVVGNVTADPQVRLIRGKENSLLWDMSAQPLILPRRTEEDAGA